MREEYCELLLLRFNIRISRELCREHVATRVDRTALELWLAGIYIQTEHIAHLPENLDPGVIATLPNGCGAPLIDGNHRAARALLEGKEFFAFVLSESETLELLQRSMGTGLANEYWSRLINAKPDPNDG